MKPRGGKLSIMEEEEERKRKEDGNVGVRGEKEEKRGGSW